MVDEIRKQIASKMSVPIIAVFMFFSAMGGWSFNYVLEQTKIAKAEVLAYCEGQIDMVKDNSTRRMNDVLEALRDLKKDVRSLRECLDRYMIDDRNRE